MVATPTHGGVAIVSSVESVEKSRRNTEFVSAQRRNLGQHCVEAQVDDALMTWRYVCHEARNKQEFVEVL